MRTAIFADLHDVLDGWAAVARDAAALGVERFVYLGDAGRSARVYARLRDCGIACTFGNWEVSGLQRMDASLADWVSTWPGVIREGPLAFCHATPDLPAEVHTTAQAAEWMATGRRWHALFPRLHHDEAAVWQALAWMEIEDVTVTFHGHTHVQTVWTWTPTVTGAPQLRMTTNLTRIEPATGARVIVGVGSAGQPDDGPWPRYAVYDDACRVIYLRAVKT